MLVGALNRPMDATSQRLDESLELDAELELMDWARAAGVSADELRLALKASPASAELRKAA